MGSVPTIAVEDRLAAIRHEDTGGTGVGVDFGPDGTAMAGEHSIEAGRREPQRAFAYDNLRAFIIVMVVLQHSILAYMVSASLEKPNPVLGTFIVVDPSRWLGFDVIALFNDVFFMSLMFFISGLFVWRSLQRKGAGSFLRDRALRLGIPFALVVTFLTPLAVYPALLVSHSGTSYLAAWRAMLTARGWPSGPVWFLWILLVLDCFAALVYLAAPRLDQALRTRWAPVFERPLMFLGVLLGVSLVAYVPLEVLFGPYRWFGQGLGPFWVQSSRTLLYPTYFAAGVAVGAFGLTSSAFSAEGALSRRTRQWRIAGVIAFVSAAMVASAVTSGVAYGLVFVLACALMGLAVISVFLAHANGTSRMWRSLSDNSYGIFLLHYPFVTWLQYLLLGVGLSAVAKAPIVFCGALGLSWALTAGLRRVPVVARVI